MITRGILPKRVLELVCWSMAKLGPYTTLHTPCQWKKTIPLRKVWTSGSWDSKLNAWPLHHGSGVYVYYICRLLLTQVDIVLPAFRNFPSRFRMHLQFLLSCDVQENELVCSWDPVSESHPVKSSFMYTPLSYGIRVFFVPSCSTVLIKMLGKLFLDMPFLYKDTIFTNPYCGIVIVVKDFDLQGIHLMGFTHGWDIYQQIWNMEIILMTLIGKWLSCVFFFSCWMTSICKHHELQLLS